MATILLIKDPLSVTDHSAEKHTCDGGTFFDWLQGHFEGFTEFAIPTVCVLNGEPFMRADWKTRQLKDDDIVQAVPVQEGPIALVAIVVVAAVAAVAVSLLTIAPTPNTPGRQDAGQPDPVFTYRGRQNQNRLGFPVESGYGLNRHFPSIAATPYVRYIDNNQFFYGLYSLGHGYQDVRDIWIEDSPIENFQEAEAFVLNPGDDLAVFDNNVVTSSEVGAIELFGPNEDDYPAGGWVGPFILNGADAATDRLEADFTLPQGLYFSNDQGGLDSRTVNWDIQFQKVDGNGDPDGDWLDPSDYLIVETYTREIFPGYNGSGESAGSWVFQGATWGATDGQGSSGETKTINSNPGLGGLNQTRTIKRYFISESRTLRTNTPQRFTRTVYMPDSGRWQMRARRTNNAPTSHREAGAFIWESARAFLPNISGFGTKTLLAVKIRASNNLNDSSSSRINVWSNRMLPVWNETDAWGEKDVEEGTNTFLVDGVQYEPTRNPVWAVIDAFKAQYGGRLTDTYFHLPTWKALADQFDLLGITFDWIFDQQATVWEVAQSILAVGRTVPILDGTQVLPIRDDAKTAPSYIFNQHNIVRDSFNYSIKLPGEDEYDGLIVTYLNDNERLPETVLCSMSDDPAEPVNPEKLTIPGLSDRDNAYRLGLYLRAKRRYHSRNLSIQTGTEGHLPLFGSMIGVVHDLFEWGQGSFIKSVNGATIELYEPVTFTEGQTHQVAIRDRYGDFLGPYEVTEGAHSQQIIAGETIPTANLLFDDEYELPLLQFGITNQWSKLLTVVRISSVDSDVFEITAVNYNAIIYSFDSVTAPPLETYNNFTVPDLPTINDLSVDNIPNTITQAIAKWTVALGAQSYIVEQSTDNGVTWDVVATISTNFFTLQVTPGRLDIRVAGINKGQGAYAFWVGVVGFVRAVDDSGNVMADDAGNIAVESEIT